MERMNPVSLVRVLFFSVLFLSIHACKDPYEQKCRDICKFYISCAEDEFRGKREITKADRDMLVIDCESGCLREQGFAIPCYESEKTCKGFNRCILDSGMMD